MAKIVIVGGGFAGTSAAREFERASIRSATQRDDVTLVDQRNFMLFTPMLPEVAGGSIETRHIVAPFRSYLKKTTFELGEITAVDLSGRTITLRHPVTQRSRELRYDELVLAFGSTNSTMGVPGAERFALPLQRIEDARKIRSRIIGAMEVAAGTKDLSERDALLRFVIVGGGFTGVEAAGELRGFVHALVKYYPSVEAGQVEFAVVQSEDRLLPHLPQKFGKYAAASLRERGVQILLGAKVAKVDENGLDLTSGKHLASRTIVWAAGTKPAPIVQDLGLETSEHGAVKVNPDFSVPDRAHLWAIGDCAAIPKRGGGTYAPLAQNAVREGPLLARNVLASISGSRTKRFRYRTLGQMASLGNRQALTALPGGRMITGTPAWFLWRSYYLSRLPGLQQKVRVALDWTLDAVFPPEMAWLPSLNGEQDETAR